MNEEKQKILNIFENNVKLKKPKNREKQEQIKKLLIETFKIEGKEDGENK